MCLSVWSRTTVLDWGQRLKHILLLNYYCFITFSPYFWSLSPFDSISAPLPFCNIFLPPTHCFSLPQISPFLISSLSLFISLSVPHSGSLENALSHSWKKSAASLPQLSFDSLSQEMWNNPQTHTDIHSINPLLHPFSVSKTTAMQQHEQVGGKKGKETERETEGERKLL